jgi:Mg2+-importing ATPase
VLHAQKTPVNTLIRRAEEVDEAAVVPGPAVAPSPDLISAEPGPGALSAAYERLGASARGLTAVEARRRLLQYGPNEPARPRRGAGIAQFLRFLANPLVIILLIAGVVSAALGETVNASLIVLMVVLSVVLNFAQSYRSQRAAERLRETVAPTASVMRDGAWAEIARRELVPGDVIRLSAGDRVPADARLIETRDLHVQQAALPG